MQMKETAEDSPASVLPIAERAVLPVPGQPVLPTSGSPPNLQGAEQCRRLSGRAALAHTQILVVIALTYDGKPVPAGRSPYEDVRLAEWVTIIQFGAASCLKQIVRPVRQIAHCLPGRLWP
jgi:hypothetical protein